MYAKYKLHVVNQIHVKHTNPIQLRWMECLGNKSGSKC